MKYYFINIYFLIFFEHTKFLYIIYIYIYSLYLLFLLLYFTLLLLCDISTVYYMLCLCYSHTLLPAYHIVSGRKCRNIFYKLNIYN